MTTNADFKQRLAAILAADAVEYSRLMAEDERSTVAALDAARAIFRTQIDSNDGRVVDMAGDSVLAMFETVTGAVAAALTIQEDIGGLADAAPEYRRMRFRIGVHLGDVIEKSDGTVYGDGVNIAARLQGLAEPGGIIVSDAVRGAVKGKVTAAFEDQGEQAVKNIVDPVHAWRVRLRGQELDDRSVATANRDRGRPSLAVMPFTNLGGDPEQAYFVDGVVDDIITALSRVRWFFVIARSSSFTYRGRAVDAKQVGKELGVRYLLQGTVRKAQGRLRIAVQLVEAETGRHVWGERFDRGMADIFELQDEITHSVVAAIEPNLRLAEYERARKRPTSSLQAYELVLRGWQNVAMTSGRQGNDEALADLRRAIALDPDYSAAKALLAWAMQLRKSAFAAAPAESDEGVRMAREALADHRDDPITLVAAGWALCFLDARHEEAGDAVDRALTLAPDLASVLNLAGWVRLLGGDAHAATEIFERAMRLSPLDPQMAHLRTGLALAHLAAGKFEDALENAQRASRDRPDYAQALRPMLYSLVELGRLDEARAVGQRLRQATPDFTVSWFQRSAPWKDQDFKARCVRALRAAGIPE
ncbi:adenylate/guanylate cyclase domain-containing protein [Variovorax sp. YR216]|uniref:adenylate/guanylate cyclase domain-containing protein n=1 Tax=Variovorax sp. YR216 TaxID=1882828 RepID=UPI00089A594E|nr:adenylate/guanylate cyclase domain-containing protein [Variovorax sp. YR216]SEB24536.1 adenylate cyclase [Variovorax sp. YR216]